MEETFLSSLGLNPDSKEAAKKYMAEKDITTLFESVTAGLLHHRPENPVDFVQNCLDSLKQNPDVIVKWNTFIDWDPSSASRTAAGSPSSASQTASQNSLAETSAMKEETSNKEEKITE